MKASKALEARLEGWAAEYAGGRYDNVGWPGISPMATIAKYHGRAPEGLTGEVIALGTPADEVEAAVVALERMRDGFKPGRVLRAEFWIRAGEDVKLQALRRVGLPMSRQGYYGYLNSALFHVAAWIRVPASDIERPTEPRVFLRTG
jgi:hypothetical protein